MKQAIVIGSGAGGATIARELQGRFAVTILEAGGAFRPLGLGLNTFETLKRSGLLLDEREIQLVFPTMRIQKTADMVLVRGAGLGGTTTVCAGNAARMDRDLRALGINLDAEFDELAQEVPISTAHQRRWREHTRRLFQICAEMGLDPQPMPKMGRYERCVGCGRCVLGCPYGVKWDTRQFIAQAEQRGARVVTRCRVERLALSEGRAIGVWARHGLVHRFLPADLVIVAAGGLGTPVILQDSGIPCEERLFVDPVLCVATQWKGCNQCREVTMPFVVQREHYIVSPYFDYLSFPFNRAWAYPAQDTLVLMVKLADEMVGSITHGAVHKALTAADRAGLADGVGLCREILERLGARQEDLFLGTVNAGHPGGMLPLTEREAKTLHSDRLPPNVYVADATLLPRSMGNPPIMTIMALAKRIAKLCAV